jgi:hypothetical protein
VAQTQAEAAQQGQGSSEGEGEEEEGDAAQHTQQAQQAQAEVQAAVHGVVQAALHESEEDREAAQLPMVEGDYQGDAGAEEGGNMGAAAGLTATA